MIEEVYKNIYRITVPLAGNPLRSLNSYFIKSGDDQLLIDMGFRRADCKEALDSALNELSADRSKLNVVATHLHSDHSGMLDLFVGKNGKMYMSEPDAEYLQKDKKTSAQFAEKVSSYFIENGFKIDWIQYQLKENPAFKERLPNCCSLPIIRMKTGAKITVGEYEFTWIVVPGHTPGNSMLYEKKHKIMFTGDHVLFTITPNITYWECMPNSLGLYLESLERSKEYDVSLALPGHREIVQDAYNNRIDALIKHHETRLSETLEIIRTNPDLNATEIAGKMTWKIKTKNWEEFPLTQKWFAVGEAMSHIDYLMDTGKIECIKKDGLKTYHCK